MCVFSMRTFTSHTATAQTISGMSCGVGVYITLEETPLLQNLGAQKRGWCRGCFSRGLYPKFYGTCYGSN